ncbi:right-handed parallel beta-helix repeat-containing protein, partial [Planctomycetota bacterium]
MLPNKQTKLYIFILLAVILLGIWPGASVAATIYVNADASTGGDGNSWATALKYLQDALNDAESGDEIWVAEGTYKPDRDEGGNVTPGTRTEKFRLINGVAIYGGFPPGGGEWYERDPNDPNNETILSGNIGAAGAWGDNSYHVVAGGGTDETAVLDGFIITAGNANGSSGARRRGGGMYNNNGDPTLTNCTFIGNRASGAGGGMYNLNSSNPTVTNCTFSDNSAEYGGGMYNNNSSPELTNCTFSDNLAQGEGGGMYNNNSSPELTNCTFSDNSADNGGGMQNNGSNPTLTNCTFSGNSATTWDAGGGMLNISSSPTLTNCTFSGNSAEFGGGMTNWENSSPTVTGCTFTDNWATYNGGGMFNYESSPTVTNCTFTGNSAGDVGGGMYNEENSSPTVTDCTFSGNSTTWAGGGMFNSVSNPTVTNCTFSGNSAENGGGMNNNYSSATVTNCAFSGNWAGWAGGGMQNHQSSSTVTDCTFSGNSAGDAGGGLNNSVNSNSTVTNCTFRGNSAEHGGGMLNHESSPTVTNCTFIGNWTGGAGGGLNNSFNGNSMLTNCTFTGNSAEHGGGMFNHESSPTLTNCTFSDNSAVWNGGGVGNNNSSSTLANCILWGNRARYGSQIYKDGTSSATVSYSDVQGGWPGTGNINADPLFVGPKIGEPPEDAIAYWKFDEGEGSIAYDSAGENHGTLMNGPQWTTGQLDGALSFDGHDDYVSAGDIPELHATDSFTWSFWVNLESGNGSTDIIVGNRAQTTGFHFIKFTPTRFEYYNYGHDGTINYTVPTERWVHLVVVKDAANLTYYSDASVVGTGIVSQDMPSNPLYFAGDPGYGEYAACRIDEVAIYDRALSAEEIQQFYQMDYHLLPTSPCIDAGDNSAVPAGVTTDLDGNARIIDFDFDGTATVDMGAYENTILIYVDNSAVGSNDGSSWDDAFNNLYDALALAQHGDNILVGEGTYYPDTTGLANPRDASFALKNGVTLEGGYAGYGAPDPDARDVGLYETILSGDIGIEGDSSDNCYHVFYHPEGINLDATAILDGFTITAGSALGFLGSSHWGGGMYNESSSPTITNCTFSGNSAGGMNGGGGGMYNKFSNPTLINCTFSGNSSWGKYNRGGGMRNDESSPTLTNCTFTNNSAQVVFYGGGGGMSNAGSNPMLTNCTFSRNSANHGGGMDNESSSPTVTNCILWGNTAIAGLQIYNDGTSSATVSYSDVQGGWSGNGNIGDDPLFLYASGGDLRLLPASPCIDAGDNTAVPPDTSDLDGDGDTVEPTPWDLDGRP